jgi:hypothetical protein
MYSEIWGADHAVFFFWEEGWDGMGARDIIEEVYARTRMIVCKGFSALSHTTFLILFLPVRI